MAHFLVGYWLEILTHMGRGALMRSHFKPLRIFPAILWARQIAQSWEVTANPVTITFNIRPGIMWAGNTLLGMASRELTAADVAYSLTRGMAAPIVSGTFWFVTSVTAPSKYTAVVNCSSFNVNWGYFIAYRYMVGMITCPESGNSTVGGGSEDWHNQVSDGPFIITNYVEGSECTYERNPNYWGKTTINGKSYNLPFIDTLEYPIIPEEATTVAALRTGKLIGGLILQIPMQPP